MADKEDPKSETEELQYLLCRADSMLLTANGALREIIMQLREEVVSKVAAPKTIPLADTTTDLLSQRYIRTKR